MRKEEILDTKLTALYLKVSRRFEEIVINLVEKEEGLVRKKMRVHSPKNFLGVHKLRPQKIIDPTYHIIKKKHSIHQAE